MNTRISIPKGKRRNAVKKAYLFIIIALMVFSLVLPSNATIATGSSTNANSGSGMTVTIDKPVDTVSGDVLVACIVATSRVARRAEVTPPDGWQLIRHTYATQSWYYEMLTYYKAAGAGEPSSYTWTSTEYNTSGGITRLTGVDINHVVDVSAESQGEGTSPTIAAAPSVTANYANDIVINFFGTYEPLASPFFTILPIIETPIQLYEYAPLKSGDYLPPNLAAYYRVLTSAGTAGSKDCYLTANPGSTVRWVAQTVAFKASPRAYFPTASGSGEEATSAHWATVNLAPNAQGPVEVNFTVSGTAKPGSDYTMITTSPITVAEGSGSASIGLNISEDSLYEENETIIITLGTGQEYYLSGNTEYTYTINNDDLTVPASVIAAGAFRTSVTPTDTSLQVLQIPNPGAVQGEFLLAAITRQGSSWSQTITPPDGWTLIRETHRTNSQGMCLATYYKIAGSDEPSVYSWGIPDEHSSMGCHASGGITRYTGVDIIQPVDVSNATSGTMPNGSSGTVSIPSVYPSYANDHIVSAIGIYNPVTSISTPAGMAERYEIKHSIAPYNSMDLLWPTTQVSDMAWAPATGTALKTATVERFITGENTDWASQTIALKTSQLSVSDASFVEGNSSSANVVVTVTLDHPTNVPVTFNWLTEDGTAVGHEPKQTGDDYMLYGGAGTIGKGQTSCELVIPIYGDTTLESDETFYVNLSNVIGATVLDGKAAIKILDNDSNITINDVSQVEGNSGTTNFNFTVTLDPVCSVPVTVTYFLPTEGTAVQGTDYGNTTGTLEFAPGDRTKTISVSVIGDTDFESNETFVVFLSSATNAHISDDRGTGTIINDDAQIPTMSVNDVSLAEGNSGTSNMVFTVTLSLASSNNVTVNYATANGTATSGSDYTSTSGTLTILAGKTSGTISVPVVGDAAYESNETFYVNLSSPANATLIDSQGMGTINNDDAIHASINDADQAEGNVGITSFIFTVTLDSASSSTVTMKYATANDTAIAGPDYNGYASETLTFNAGETSKTITVQVNGDNIHESDETFYVNLSNASDAAISDSQGLGTIRDDDPIPTYALTMAVSPADSGTATDQTGASPYQEGKLVNISATPASGYHFVNWTAAVGSFADPDAASTVFTMPAQAVTVTANFVLVTYTVSFDSQGGSAVSDKIVTLGEMVAKPSDPGRTGYTFAGWYKDAACADDWDFSTETVNADITLYARWAILDQTLLPAETSVGGYNGTYAQTFTVGTTGQLYKVSFYFGNYQSAVTFTTQIQTVTSSDIPTGTVLTGKIIDLPASTGRWVDVTLSEPLSVKAGERYAIVWSGLNSQTSMYGSPSDSYAGGRALMVSLSAWYPAGSTGDFAFRTYVLTTPGITLTPPDGLVTTETGGTDTFTVVLDSQPAADVTVTLSSSDATEGTIAPASLTFTPSNWKTPQTVTITGVDDALPDGDISYAISATASSTDLSYHGIIASASASNQDVEGIAPVVSLNPESKSITYGDNTSFTASATGTPAPSVQWQLSTDGGSHFSNISDGGVYSGVTTNTLSLTRPPVSYNGYAYRAVFANGFAPDAATSAATLDVIRLNITGSFTAANKVYDATAAADVTDRNLSGVLADDTVTLTGGTAAFADKNAGTGKLVALTGASLTGAQAGNYTLNSVTDAKADIAPKSVNPSIAANDKPYDGKTAATLSSQTVSGVIGSEVVNLVVGSAVFADEDVGKWTVTASSLSLEGADAGNYALSVATAADTAEITAIKLTISGAAAQNKFYDGDTDATVDFSGASLTGVISGDSVSIDSTGYTAYFNNKDVDDLKPVTVSGVTLSGTDAGNYTVSQPVGLTADITPLYIAGSFTADNKIYDRTTDATVSGRSLSGVLAGDAVTLTDGIAAFADKNAGTDKTVMLTGATLAGTNAGNYILRGVAVANADITPKEVTPSIIANDKPYDGTTTATLSSQTVSGVISPDEVTLLAGTVNFADEDVGTWPVTASLLSLGGADAANYALSAATVTDSAEITAIKLTISGAAAQNKTYDGDTDATVDFSGASLTGAISGDSVSINSAGYSADFNNKDVDDLKPVTVSGVTLSGTDAGNYTVSQPVGLTADITLLYIAGSFKADDKIYDGNTSAAVLGRYLSGVIENDDVSLTGGTAAFSDRNAGMGKMVTLTGATLSGTDAGNYILRGVAVANADITPKEVTPSIIANDKPYDGTTAATLSSQTVSGEIGSEVVNLVVGSATFADEDVGTWTVTASSLSLSGADAANYALSAATVTDSAEITAIKLTISDAVAQDKTYDGDTDATVDFSGISLIGVIDGDIVSINSAGYSADFNNKDVGDLKPVTVSGVTLSGTDAGNYTVSQPAGLTADITPLYIAGSFKADDKIYDGNTTATVLGRYLSGVIGSDDVSLTGGTAAFADRNAGMGKTVTLTGATLSGTDAGNYILRGVAVANADITTRAIVVTAITDTKVYDGNTTSDETPVISSTSGLVAGDSAVWTQTFDTKDAGTNKVMTPAGTVNDGNDGKNYSVTFSNVNTGVIEKAELTVTADDKSSQYSDPRKEFTSVISGFKSVESLATSGVTGSPSYTTDPDISNPVTQQPGNYTIKPDTGSLSSNNYKFTFVNGTYAVIKEDAEFTFDMQNPVSVKVSTDGGNNAAFVWKVTITQAEDGNVGDLSNIIKSDITLTFSSVGSGGIKSFVASGFDPASGIATFNVPAGVLIVETYAASVSLDNVWFKANPVEEVLVIYDPSLGFTTGGGWFYWPKGTSNPELEGVKVNCGFTMKYNRKGTSIQGSFLLIAHMSDGSIVRIKSNAISGLAIIQKTYPGIASFSGKCVYTRVDEYGSVLAEAGNQDFTVYVQDMNEPGEATDMFWFKTKLTLAGEAPFSLDNDKDNMVDDAEYVLLGGGNIVVPHSTGSSSDPVEEDTPTVPNKKK